MAGEYHISSLVVRTLPERFDDVIAAINALPNAEIYRSDPGGKIVIVLETENEHEIATRLGAIETLPGVLNASLIYHHIEETAQDIQESL